MKIQNLFEDIEFKLLVLAASIGFVAKYLGFIPEEQLFSVSSFFKSSPNEIPTSFEAFLKISE